MDTFRSSQPRPSPTLNLDYHSAKREYKSMEVVIDEEVSSREDVEKLGIQPGDIR